MKRRAKIVGTLGPASSDVATIARLIRAGLNVARLNMSHGTHEYHAQLIENIREASRLEESEVAILMDLQGPKIRVDKLAEPLELKEGEEWILASAKVKEKFQNHPEFKTRFIPTVYKDLVKDAHEGCVILFDDGLLEAKTLEKVTDKDAEYLKIKIVVGGLLKSNKGINLPDATVTAPSVTKKDKEDLMFGLEHGIDYVALSFVRRKEDILEVKYLLHELKVNIPVVAKIERPEAIQNIKEIIKVTDVIMVARGDMAVEIGNHQVPPVQKEIINLCNEAGVPVITATQMLESMVSNPRPTRAEASDVANAIWDGTDAVMLSAETASGKYPIESISMMGKIIEEAEKIPKERPLLRHIDLSSVTASNQVAASLIAEKITARWILCVTETGESCVKMSRFRPKTPVLAVTNSMKVVRKVCLLWGIYPYYFDEQAAEEAASDQEGSRGEKEKTNPEYQMIEVLKERKMVQGGDKVVISYGGGKYFTRERSYSIRVEFIKNAPRVEGGSDTLEEAEFEKGKILLDTHICASCQSCVSVCPHDIWAVTQDEDKRTYINQAKAPECTLDMECVDACPAGAIEIIPKDFP